MFLLQIAIPAPAQRSDTFNVYFDRNDARLNLKGTDLINKLIAGGSIVRGQKFTLSGYADYLGTDGHNDSLSLSRAKSVADHFIKKGFNKEDITLCVGKGEIDRTAAGKNGFSSDRKVQIITAKQKKKVLATAGANQTFFNIEMVKVRGGNFNFSIGKYDITEAQWRAVMGRNSSRLNKCDSCPVVMVSWYDVQEFLKKLDSLTGKDYRLPTEDEWEFAAKGGNKSKNYIYAGSNDIDQVAWYTANSGSRIHPVGQKLPNELGIYDMSGNVWQHCSDLYTASGGDHVLRGGCFFLKPVYCKWAGLNNFSRNFVASDNRNDADGFRVALSSAQDK